MEATVAAHAARPRMRRSRDGLRDGRRIGTASRKRLCAGQRRAVRQRLQRGPSRHGAHVVRRAAAGRSRTGRPIEKSTATLPDRARRNMRASGRSAVLENRNAYELRTWAHPWMGG